MSKTVWSASRPVKPEADPEVVKLSDLLNSDRRSTFALANVSGLSAQTIRKLRAKQTRVPQHLTISMIYQALGYGIVYRKSSK